MEIQLQTKISVLLEKIYYLQQSIQQGNGIVSKVDKDLLVNYVRELYELSLTLPVSSPQQYPVQNYPYPPVNQEYPPQYMPPQGFQQAPIQQPSYQPSPQASQQNQNVNPFVQNQGTLNSPVNGANGNGVNGSNGSYNNGNGKENNGGAQHLNAAFTFSNGKRTLSESIKIKTANDKPSLNEHFKKAEPELVGKMQPIKDLQTFIGLNKRFSYINYLFGNDANLYDEAIEKINLSKNVSEAKDYINNHLVPKLNWDSSTDMVSEFYKLVERRFIK